MPFSGNTEFHPSYHGNPTKSLNHYQIHNTAFTDLNMVCPSYVGLQRRRQHHLSPHVSDGQREGEAPATVRRVGREETPPHQRGGRQDSPREWVAA